MNKTYRGAFQVAAGVILASACFLIRAQSQPSEPESIPLLRVVAAPEKYDGKKVRLIGFVRLEFEGNVMYIHREDYQNALLGNGIWIDVPSNLNQQARKQRSMKYCILEGMFNAKNKGHMGMWSGSLTNITRFDVWSDPAKPLH